MTKVQRYTESSLSIFSQVQAEYNKAEHDMTSRLNVHHCVSYCFDEANNVIQPLKCRGTCSSHNIPCFSLLSFATGMKGYTKIQLKKI
jgi:hypothetical protein